MPNLLTEMLSKATRLTRMGQLMEATELIQRALKKPVTAQPSQQPAANDSVLRLPVPPVQAERPNTEPLVEDSPMDTFRIRSFDDGQNIHVGLELPQEPKEDDLKQAQQHLLTLAEHFGAAITTVSPKSQSTTARDQAESALRRDPEWRGFRNRDIVTPQGSELPGFVVTSIMLPKITFGDNSQEEFASELKAAETSFRRSPKFFGMAIHSYESFLKLPETKRISARR